MNDENTPEIVVVPNRRKTTSIYVDPHIWKGFIKKCRRTGQSTCHVLEAFMYAFNQALPDRPITTLPAVNVNLTVNRVIRRVRRISEEREVTEVTSGDFNKCAMCDDKPVVRFGLREPHQLSFRYLCEDHFYEHRKTYTKFFWKEIRPYRWRR